MIPDLIIIPDAPFKVLPAGIHHTSLAEVQEHFAYNKQRRLQFNGLLTAIRCLHVAGCSLLYLDGSYVTAKPIPGDYDGCWDPTGVDPNILDSVLLDFSNGRSAQKAKFLGELFPSTATNTPDETFVEFFQTEKYSGKRKGILSLPIGKPDYMKGVHGNDL